MEASEHRVAWPELFFDLIWVFTITQVTITLAAAGDAGEAARTLVLFVPLWWGWVGTTLIANLAGDLIDRAAGRLVLFGIAGCGLLMSVAIDRAYQERALVFAVGYLLLRLVLWTAWRRLPGAAERTWLEPNTVALVVVAPLFLVGALLGGAGQVTLWTAAVLVELVSPLLLRLRLRGAPFESSHLPERFGLFMIIALGETVVALGGQAAAIPLGVAGYLVLALAYAIIVLLWWTYFHYGAPAARHSLTQSTAQARIVVDVFSYAHLAYVVAIILVAVGLKKLLAHPLDQPHSLPELLLAPGAALYLLGFCYARWRMFGAATRHRFGAALACGVIAAAAPLLPLVVTAAAVTVVLLATNCYEAWLIHTGRPLPLLARQGS